MLTNSLAMLDREHLMHPVSAYRAHEAKGVTVIDSARGMLLDGAPLGRALRGRFGLELRMIISGGERILDKLARVSGDVFRARPVLTATDWPLLLARALLR